MADSNSKSEKKRAKAQVKLAKAEAKAAEAKERARIEAERSAAFSGVPGLDRLPSGIGIVVQRREGGSDLVVSGLKDEQLKRVLPHVSHEVLIAITADRNAFRARMMRFVREGLLQTAIKVVAGLIVGYLLVRFGLR